MVFYFTATGNSLYIAKQLDETPISIPQIKETQSYQDESIGIVCPIYCGEIPKIVLDFIKASQFQTPYLYLILTYGMSESDCPEFTFAQCRKVGVTFDYIGCIKMVDNFLPVFDMSQEVKQDKQIPAQLVAIKADLESRRKSIPAATEEGRKLHKQVAMINKIFPGANNGSFLKITENCTGCGVCTQVCPLGNIRIVRGRANRASKKCAFCLACIHNCPQKAIVLKQERNPNARYINPNVSLEEIIQANQQRL